MKTTHALAKSTLSVLLALAAVPAFAENHAVANLADIASENAALQVRPGDTVTLPALAEGSSYKVLNTRIATLGDDGYTLTIATPGILGVQQLDGGALTTTGAILSLPDASGSGKVFLWKSSHWDASNWTNPESWTQPGQSSNSDYPRNPDDIAILARYNNWGYEINLNGDISLGGLMIGAYTNDKNMEPYKYMVRGGTLTFARTDGENAWLQICPNGNDTGDTFYIISVAFGDTSNPIAVTATSDVDIDLGWDGVNSKCCQSRLAFQKGCTLDIPAGRTFAIYNGTPINTSGYFESVSIQGTLTGSGTLANFGHASLRLDGATSAFAGRFLEASAARDGYDRNGNTWLHDAAAPDSAMLEIDGYVWRKDYRTLAVGAGYYHAGSNHTWPGRSEIGNRLPGRAVVLNGGRLELLHEDKAWVDPTSNLVYRTDLLAVSNGFTFVTVNGPNEDTTYPPVFFSAATAVHANKATLALTCNRLWETSNSIRCETELPWFSDFAIGGIVPWFVAYMDQDQYGNAGGWQSLRFPVVDEDGHLRNDGLYNNNTSIAEADDNANVNCNGKDLGIAADKTINSLALQNTYNGGKKIGNGMTLTIASGGLTMNDKTGIGENEWNQAVPSPNCGTLAFGATAYVYSNNHQENNQSWIMCPMVAPYGWVCAFPGYLQIGGDQTGIDDELVVQAGTLTLGITRNLNGVDHAIPCQIDVPVRIVGGGSKVVIPANTEGTTLDSEQNLYFDDVGGFAGKLDIPAGKTETCLTLYTRDVMETAEWTSLERGTYGSSESSAEFIDDEHFSGAGVLVVRRDDLGQPTILIFR